MDITDEKLAEMLSTTDLIHLAKTPVDVKNLYYANQPYTYGFNVAGRPEGFWIAQGGTWIQKALEYKNPYFPTCCYVYKVAMDTDNILFINNEEDLKKMDEEISSYWLNMDYYNLQFLDSETNTKIVTEEKYMLDISKLNKKNTLWDTLVASKIIFTNPDDAKQHCEFYQKTDIPIDRFKYKDWNEVSKKYQGVYIDYSALSGHYFWVQLLDIPSWCIWDGSKIKEVKLLYNKIETNLWKHGGDELVLTENTEQWEYLFNPISEEITPITGGLDYPVARKASEIYDQTRDKIHDKIVSKLIPEHISECALYLGNTQGHCMSDEAANKVGTAIGVIGNAPDIISAAKSKLGCDTERCVLSKLASKIGEEQVRREIITNLKVVGPTDSKLLSNINIDATLKQWSLLKPQFFPFSFNMRNYASYSYQAGRILPQPDTLATIQFTDLYNGTFGTKYNCCGCVINSDTYQGDGKHWMAFFADTRGPEWTVEFFNSSGNAPAPEWINWLEKTKNAMELIIAGEKRNNSVRIVKASSVRQQSSKSECGVYSLFYIWARIHDVPCEYFTTNRIPDQLMFEFRQHLFEDPGRKIVKKFNWNEYKNTVKILWE